MAQAVTEFEASVLSRFFPAATPLVGAAKPTYPAERRCNVRGLTRLGRHLVRRMMAKGMLIELDHLSERAREQVLALAKRARYPVVSGHSDTGGRWTRAELRRLTALGGIASQRLAAPGDLAQAIAGRRAYRSPKRYFGVGLGTDTGGFSTLPAAPPAGTAKVTYPFRLGGSGPSFRRQRTGERTFDVTQDGMAHYGLLPDLLADMERRPGGREAMELLFRSAEAYVRMWELARRSR